MRQTEVILKHLKKAPITSLQAINRYGITRLGDVVFRLKPRLYASGKDIITEMVNVNTRYGKTRVARYHLVRMKK